MFLIFKILPDWIWWLVLASGIIAFLLSYLSPLKTYALIIKSIACATIATTIFIIGMLYANNTWKAIAADLQSQVNLAAQQSKTINEVVKERVVTKVQVVKVRGQEVIKYVDKEVLKIDSNCVIPPEFVKAHNSATEAPK